MQQQLEHPATLTGTGGNASWHRLVTGSYEAATAYCEPHP